MRTAFFQCCWFMALACMIKESMKYAKQNKIHYKGIQSQVISASPSESNWSASRHIMIHTKICNWWHQLVMLTSSRCLLGIIKMLRFCTASFCVRVDHARPKAPRRPGAEWLILAWGALSKSLLHSSARLCLPCLEGGSSMCCWVWSSILPRCSHFAQMPSSLPTCLPILPICLPIFKFAQLSSLPPLGSGPRYMICVTLFCTLR